MRKAQSSLSIFVHNPENAEANIFDIDGNFYGCAELSCEIFSGLKIIFTDPSLAEDLGTALLEMAHELKEKQGK